MRYCGGKHRIAKKLADTILPFAKGRNLIEPFCGGLSATVQLQPTLASDASKPLISLITSVREGWVPPEEVTETEYNQARKLPPEDPLHGFCAFCCSFGGKYWGGYAREPGRNFAKQGKNALIRKVEATRNTNFLCARYDLLKIPEGSVVYCDPPYVGTTLGYSVRDWDSEKFWNWVISTSNHSLVFVSEFKAPRGVEVFAEFPSKTDLRTTKRSQDTVEKLFVSGRAL